MNRTARPPRPPCSLAEARRRELEGPRDHSFPQPAAPRPAPPGTELYLRSDLALLQAMAPPPAPYVTHIRSLDELLERDKRREEDGFPRKIRIGRLIRPGKGGRDKVVVVPTTVEEKFLHDTSIRPPEEGSASGGAGEGEEGEVIGEQPVACAPKNFVGAGSTQPSFFNSSKPL